VTGSRKILLAKVPLPVFFVKCSNFLIFVAAIKPIARCDGRSLCVVSVPVGAIPFRLILYILQNGFPDDFSRVHVNGVERSPTFYPG
jgi:hypothetical protein